MTIPRSETQSQTRKLAQQLVLMWKAYTDYGEVNPTTRDAKVAYYQFNGACRLAHAIGYGRSPLQISSLVRGGLVGESDWFREGTLNDITERLETVLNR
jgi:hypothetical protein